MTARTIAVGGSRVRVLEAGPSGGDPVLLVHGVGGWAENWRETLAALGDRGHRAYAVDLPGFGESERVRGARYFDPERAFYARFVHGVLDALGCERAHLVGHSLGGAIVYTAAVTAPERVASLTLVAGGGIGLEVARALRLAIIPGMELVARLQRGYARAGLASCFADTRRVPEQVWLEADRYVPASLSETTRVLRSSLTLRGVRRRLREAWVGRASRYSGPVLVIWGERDAVLPAAQAGAVAGVFPHAEVRLVPDAGHLVMIEQPEAFQAALLPFLMRSRATSGWAARSESTRRGASLGGARD